MAKIKGVLSVTSKFLLLLRIMIRTIKKGFLFISQLLNNLINMR